MTDKSATQTFEISAEAAQITAAAIDAAQAEQSPDTVRAQIETQLRMTLLDIYRHDRTAGVCSDHRTRSVLVYQALALASNLGFPCGVAPDPSLGRNAAFVIIDLPKPHGRVQWLTFPTYKLTDDIRAGTLRTEAPTAMYKRLCAYCNEMVTKSSCTTATDTK